MIWVRPPFNKGECIIGSGREAQEGGDICILMADSHCCMAETNATLQSNYPPILKKHKTNK